MMIPDTDNHRAQPPGQSWFRRALIRNAPVGKKRPRESQCRKILFAAAVASILLVGCASPYHPQGWESTSSPQSGATAKPGTKRKTPGLISASGKKKVSEADQAGASAGKKRLGEATYYASYFEGRLTASGEPYDSQAMTAAHKTLPFGTKVKVTALDSGETAVVRINDRGPFVPGRIIDVSEKAAEQLGLIDQGAARVQLQVLEQ